MKTRKRRTKRGIIRGTIRRTIRCIKSGGGRLHTWRLLNRESRQE